MYAKIDSTLAVFLFGFRKRSKAAWHERSNRPLIVAGNAVELVGNECEPDTIGLIEVAQGLEEGGSESGMPGRVCRKGRCEVRPDLIAGRRTERRPAHIL